MARSGSTWSDFSRALAVHVWATAAALGRSVRGSRELGSRTSKWKETFRDSLSIDEGNRYLYTHAYIYTYIDTYVVRTLKQRPLPTALDRHAHTHTHTHTHVEKNRNSILAHMALGETTTLERGTSLALSTPPPIEKTDLSTTSHRHKKRSTRRLKREKYHQPSRI